MYVFVFNSTEFVWERGMGNGESQKRRNKSDTFFHCEKERNGSGPVLPGNTQWASQIALSVSTVPIVLFYKMD